MTDTVQISNFFGHFHFSIILTMMDRLPMMTMTTTSLVSIRLDTLFYRTINHTITDRMSQFWLESDMWMWRYHFLKIYHPLFQPKPLHFQWPSPYSVNITLTIISFCLPLLYTIGYWSYMGGSATNKGGWTNFWCCDKCKMMVLEGSLWWLMDFQATWRSIDNVKRDLLINWDECTLLICVWQWFP